MGDPAEVMALKTGNTEREEEEVMKWILSMNAQACIHKKRKEGIEYKEKGKRILTAKQP